MLLVGKICPAGEPQLEQQIAKELSLLEEISHVKISMVP